MANGLNLVSGNYEFAGLVFIENPEWWAHFGGAITPNWEADGLQLYPADDLRLLERLMADSAWTNEGLFALSEGVRRLNEITNAS